MKRTILLIVSCACIAATGLAAGDALLSGTNSAGAAGVTDETPGLPGRPLRTIVAAIVRNVMNFHNATPLSAAQKEQVAAILRNHWPEIRTQMQHARDARRAMAQAVDTAGPESPAAIDAAGKIGDAARDGALLNARIGSEIKPLLTPAQLSQMQAGILDVEATVDKTIAQ